MQTFEVSCRQPVTGKPFVVLIEAETKSVAVERAAKLHTVDPSELPQTFATDDPADKIGRKFITYVVVIAVVFVVMVLGALALFDGR
jgi:hypothetical protein